LILIMFMEAENGIKRVLFGNGKINNNCNTV
jgi:hypothetical protein